MVLTPFTVLWLENLNDTTKLVPLPEWKWICSVDIYFDPHQLVLRWQLWFLGYHKNTLLSHSKGTYCPLRGFKINHKDWKKHTHLKKTKQTINKTRKSESKTTQVKQNKNKGFAWIQNWAQQTIFVLFIALKCLLSYSLNLSSLHVCFVDNRGRFKCVGSMKHNFLLCIHCGAIIRH